MVIPLLDSPIVSLKDHIMTYTLSESLLVLISLIQCFSHSSGIIIKESPMDHDFELSFTHHSASLASIIDDCDGSVCHGVLCPKEGIHGVVVAGCGLKDSVVPARPIVEHSLLLL